MGRIGQALFDEFDNMYAITDPKDPTKRFKSVFYQERDEDDLHIVSWCLEVYRGNERFYYMILNYTSSKSLWDSRSDASKRADLLGPLGIRAVLRRLGLFWVEPRASVSTE
jgi:hypothetical protein